RTHARLPRSRVGERERWLGFGPPCFRVSPYVAQAPHAVQRSSSPLLTPDVRISRIRRSQVPLAAACTGGCRPLLGPLTQPVSRKRETLSGLRIDRSGTEAQAVLPSFYPSTYLAGLLGSTGITPLHGYYEPRRLPTRAERTVIPSRPPLNATWVCAFSRSGLPGS